MPVSASNRQPDVRFIGPVMGRYSLESRRNRGPAVQVFACRLQSISAQLLVASAPVIGALAESVVAHFQPFGTISGRISRQIDGGFCVEIEGSTEDQQRLAGKIDWYKKRTFAGVIDKRAHKRFMPRDPRSVLLMADGTLLPCLIIDVSASGVAVSADLNPELGAPLAVGRLVGRVVRHLEVGFAVRFLEDQAPDAVEDLVRAPNEWEQARRATAAGPEPTLLPVLDSGS